MATTTEASSYVSKYYSATQKRKQTRAYLMNTRDKWSIQFPHMPETLDLGRSASYVPVKTASNPDGGIVMYTSTEQLKVPITFKAHAFDSEFCPQGPMTLLEMAGRLHSLVLPNFVTTFDYAVTATAVDSNFRSTSEAAIDSGVNTTENGYGIIGTGSDKVPLPPAPVLLKLITTEFGTGVQFYGYVENVRVVLRGPWLQIEGNSSYTNLPTSAEFSFTVVHSPSYFNLKYLDFPSGLVSGNLYTAINQKNQTEDSTSSSSSSTSTVAAATVSDNNTQIVGNGSLDGSISNLDLSSYSQPTE